MTVTKLAASNKFLISALDQHSRTNLIMFHLDLNEATAFTRRMRQMVCCGRLKKERLLYGYRGDIS